MGNMYFIIEVIRNNYRVLNKNIRLRKCTFRREKWLLFPSLVIDMGMNVDEGRQSGSNTN